MKTFRDVLNVGISIILLAFIANSLFRIGSFLVQTYVFS